jgi:conjugal transfer pilus assembly protein TraD
MSKGSVAIQDIDDFENPYTVSYDLRTSLAYFIASIFILIYALFYGLEISIFGAVSMGLLILSAYEFRKGITHYKNKFSLVGKAVNLVDYEDVHKEVEQLKAQGRIGLGLGFEWKNSHREKLYIIQKFGIDKVVPAKWVASLYSRITKINLPDSSFPGSYWIHGLNSKKELPLSITFDQWTGNSMFFGTTRAGKSVALRYLATQAVLRDEVVVVIDPKGDKSIENTLRELAERKRKPFYMFHAAKPQDSCRINPLRNWSRPTELASRISALIPSTSKNDPFTAFSWRRMNAIVSAITYLNSQPTISDIKHYIEMGIDSLLKVTLEHHLEEMKVSFKQREDILLAEQEGSMEKILIIMITLYNSLSVNQKSEEVDGLISAYEHPSEHAQKMMGSLLPVLSMLSSGDLAELLSPNVDADDDRAIIDFKSVISSQGIMYVGLDGLSDGFVASALGSIMLSDLTSVAGHIYNQDEFKTSSDRQSINLFVDEASMVANDPFLNLLNQGAGAGFKTCAFTQTFSDFVDRLGSADAAKKALGNFNNKFSLRSKDQDTLEYIAGEMPKFVISQATTGTNTGSAGNNGDVSEFTGGYREQMTEQEVEAFPPEMLPNLPNMEYIGVIAGGRIIKGRFPLLK